MTRAWFVLWAPRVLSLLVAFFIGASSSVLAPTATGRSRADWEQPLRQVHA
jgi:hypothetical protein